ncbi:LysR family transcriptional regulator [Pseudidiomarina terrestris]|uniref:LysR family transcriptional regulator n=1 Tax=Pseudidiomarina terrestris TaxID=2820060 RepID=A0AAW7R1C4_9GAMM|nr:MULTISPECIES: LysR family transcriptional regulator [unclassified Pseudidiomarina]MDN7125093.1 LysR family transcriptional regulator [Pseudidiomarina sp. 1APP75-32.1]MDN7129853.1 LysR family transcriptional regulator [Pseudidiomarina sp. 1APR75-15]MDN7136012.1 LysR family transcriptional regulator [Pseudidiomarina sp. 1ASP75-5]MDN7138455.1 LysR family transcriptional regulator [Pseudidiomarina sp. 1ASP75-14]MEA3589041.1 LysR family transcriptional regulator [Pseudidiomarina sp. 1APP75-27a]
MNNIKDIDLNLLVYLDMLLRERNVTKAAAQLNITQPAMSNGLKRLRSLLNDPILVRTSEGMIPTETAKRMQDPVRQILYSVEEMVQPARDFEPASTDRVFRIMASDYAASTLMPKLLASLKAQAPMVTLDIMTPSDISFHDVENGKVDIAINRFEKLPQSFHQKALWEDDFSCLMRNDHPLLQDYSLANYLQAEHVWVSKTGFGVGVGMDPHDAQKLGWVDEALAQLGHKRDIRVFTRNYHVAMHLARQGLIATLPTRAALLYQDDEELTLRQPPFAIPDLDLTMIWSPLLQHDAGHRWFRQLVAETAENP